MVESALPLWRVEVRARERMEETRVDTLFMTASRKEISGENLLATESKPAEVKMYQDENLMANERESVEKKGSLEVAGKDDEQYQDGNLMATERESVEKKGSLEVAGKGDEKYQTMGSILVEI
ncbi:hypothetical protein SADUNF_Sadunf17G0075900 [Salix dunnii]|uniref:Uncharacterized protein n=1 Tax=Salix dunnii TaxID=1413687 RepID=A0A835JAB3_9ROSI|nr:hypothetical protein SADUNF_Sadunf17G0075900 [Salix dunnii]